MTRTAWNRVRLSLLVISSLFPVHVRAAETSLDFARDVAPILQQHCIRCHHPENARGEVSLSGPADLLDSAWITPREPDNSPLLELVTPQNGKRPRMPQEGAVLSAEQVAVLRRWIENGADWPADVTVKEVSKAGPDWWSWQPVKSVRPPDIDQAAAQVGTDQAGAVQGGPAQVGHGDWSQSEIDRFVFARLQEKGLYPSPQADRRTLIRRLAFDLHGLPPTPEAIRRFEKDTDPHAYERLVDEYLDSPRYGERWARHWLDIAHYADTHGFERDQRRDHAWRYRDWVIQAFNADLPYNTFLKHQLAGDVLAPDDPQATIATGFLAAGPWDFVGQVETQSPVLRRAARADDLDDMVTQVMTAACGITVNCARCHDHKLDPIPQRDYYALWAVFAGVRRAERDVSASEVAEIAARRQALLDEMHTVRNQLRTLQGQVVNLADLVGGGNGQLSGTPGGGIDQLTGHSLPATRGLAAGVQPNQFVPSPLRFVDGVVVPQSDPEGTVVSSTGLTIRDVPRTSGEVWDAVRNGPVFSQFSTSLGGTNFAEGGHTLLGLHANAAITFDLEELRASGIAAVQRLTTQVGYFGKTPREGASFAIYLDGVRVAGAEKIGRDDGLIAVDLPLPEDTRFLTLMATDGDNGISHDQICFGDPWLGNSATTAPDASAQQAIANLTARLTSLEQQLQSLPTQARVYAVVSETPAPVHVLKRGDPEQPAEPVDPGTISTITSLSAKLGSPESNEGSNRVALAEWIVAPENPLTRRVLVNRLWHHHFGIGLVDTPSDFGFGGGRPTHPELLDWLADTFLKSGWSLKSMHRLICLSQTYRQQSAPPESPATRRAQEVDAGNRLLWRMHARRLDAESLRDSVLSVSGKLNLEMYGPGFRDFDYQEEYAPVYRYVTPDRPDLWRRSIYRFIVRTTAHQFLTTLDCPSPANLVPARNVTTTALQSLALLNNEFMLQQSRYFADRIQTELPAAPREQAIRAFELAFGRTPTPGELQLATTFLKQRDLTQLCRMLLNANEFVYID